VIELSDAAWTAAATVLVAIITPVAAVVMKRSDKAVKTSDQANPSEHHVLTADANQQHQATDQSTQT